MLIQVTKISGKSNFAQQGRRSQTRGHHLFWERIKRLSVNPLQGRKTGSHIQDVDALPAEASQFLCTLGSWFELARRFFLKVEEIDKMVEPDSYNWIVFFLF